MTRAQIRHLPVVNDGKIVGMLSERDVLAARANAKPNEDWRTIPVRQAMKSPVHTAAPDDSVSEVAGRLAIEKIGAMPIVDIKGKLVGFVTITDVLEADVRDKVAPTPATLATAGDVMTTFPITVRSDTNLIDAVKIMLDRHVRHLPVLEGDDRTKIVGMLSEADVRTAIGDLARYVEAGAKAPTKRVAEVMKKPALIATVAQPLVELARRFADERVEAVPVVDDTKALVGIISYVDALRVLSTR